MPAVRVPSRPTLDLPAPRPDRPRPDRPRSDRRGRPDRTAAALLDLVRAVAARPELWRDHLPPDHLPPDHLPPDHLPPDQLPADQLPADQLPADHLPDHLPPAHRGRHWARLPSPADVDLWLLTWLPGQATDLHDHGDAAAAFTVVRGSVDEVREAGAGRPALTTHRLAVGDTRWMAPGLRHDVRHAGTGPAASLHAYSPRLTRMTFWTPTATGLRAVRTVHTDQPEQEETP